MPAPSQYEQGWADAVEASLVAAGHPVKWPVDPPDPPDPPTLKIPPTKPYAPTPTFKDSGSFRFETSNVDTGQRWVDADYIAHGMPYLYSDAVTGNHDHAWWVPGDRQGYAAGYAFLYDKHPNPLPEPFATEHGPVQRDPDEGHFIGRVTVARPPDAAYSKVNDVYMEEGQRYYDGDLYTGGGQEIPDEDAWAVSKSDFVYENDTRPGQKIRVGMWRERPKGVFEIADIRDFTTLKTYAPPASIKFRVIPEITESPDGQGNRVAVVMFENNIPGTLFYYDAMANGLVTVEIDGA
jgi:hypothetical protein